MWLQWQHSAVMRKLPRIQQVFLNHIRGLHYKEFLPGSNTAAALLIFKWKMIPIHHHLRIKAKPNTNSTFIIITIIATRIQLPKVMFSALQMKRSMEKDERHLLTTKYTSNVQKMRLKKKITNCKQRAKRSEQCNIMSEISHSMHSITLLVHWCSKVYKPICLCRFSGICQPSVNFIQQRLVYHGRCHTFPWHLLYSIHYNLKFLQYNEKNFNQYTTLICCL